MKKLRTLRNTVWLYFIIFIISILFLLWLTFAVSLPISYKNLKTRDIQKIANYILAAGGDANFTTDMLDKLAYDHDMCILVLDHRGLSAYSFDMLGGNCLIHGRNMSLLYQYRAKAAANPDGIYYAEVFNTRFNTDTLLFTMIIGDVEQPSGYMYLNTSLEPLDSAAAIIRTQILWISVALMILGLGISFFLAKLIETPIKRITRSAKKLAQGEEAGFDGRGYAETELLADALNYAAAEISKVSSLRRDIIANISHDLRTPLTMVKAYAEMVRDISGGNPEKRAEHINIIIDESDRLASLVNDILDLSVLESGAYEINITEFDITERIYGILERYKVFSEMQGYEFITALDKPFTVFADVIKIEQVIYNLINNAINYAGEKKNVYIVQRNFADRTLIEITDTGAGIDKELLPLIFDRYYRAEKSKREIFGTGLGLSIVKQILKQHKCKFGVRSRMGTGSTFWFEIAGKERRFGGLENEKDAFYIQPEFGQGANQDQTG